MPLLSPASSEQLAQIIVRAFSKREVEQFVRVRLNEDLFASISSDKKTLNEIAAELVIWCDHRDRSKELLEALIGERQRNVPLRVMMTNLGMTEPAPVARPDTAGLASQFGNGLVNLSQTVAPALATPGGAMALGQLYGTLRPCRDQLCWLRRYKGLHDCLHNLQSKFGVVDRATRVFARTSTSNPNDTTEHDEARTELVQYALDVRQLVENARLELRPDPPLPTQDSEDAWVKIFDDAATRFDVAVANDSPPAVSDAVQRLRALVRQAKVVNDHLLFLVHQPNLRELARAMQGVDDRLASAAAVAGAFREGLNAIKKLAPDLVNLVEEHDEWQELEIEFALAESQAGLEPANRFASWSDAKTRLLALCQINHDNWLANQVNTAATRYDASRLASKRDADAAFAAVRHAFGMMFFSVDAQLLQLTVELADQADDLERAVVDLATLLGIPTSVN